MFEGLWFGQRGQNKTVIEKKQPPQAEVVWIGLEEGENLIKALSVEA